jgi:transglutaminase-like putative cysteine protease
LKITEGLESPYLKAVAIERWLSESFVYTLTPGDVPRQDFVEFLETGTGYCEYYASAMTVLSRCAVFRPLFTATE